MNYVSEMLEKSYDQLNTICRGREDLPFQLSIEIRKIQDKCKVTSYIENYLEKRKIADTMMEYFVDEEELIDVVNYVNNRDAIIIAGAPAIRYSKDYTTIVGMKTQIKFDNASHYPEVIDQANRYALLKDGLTNGNKLSEGMEYQNWEFIPTMRFFDTSKYTMALQRAATVLEEKIAEDIMLVDGNEWFKKRVINREENAENYLVKYNSLDHTYFVKRDQEKLMKKRNQHLYH